MVGLPGARFEYSSKVTESGLSAGSNLKSKFGQQGIDLIYVKPALARLCSLPESSLRVTGANWGVSSARPFHHAAREACGSVSIRTQGPSPALSAATARCAARVVLPAPPFWLAKTIAFLIVLSCFLDRKNGRFRAFGLRQYRKEKQKARFNLPIL